MRDAARVLGYPYVVGDKVAKAMPPLVMGRDTPLKYCFEESEKYADGYKAAAELRAMVDTDTTWPRSSRWPGAWRACAARTASMPRRW